MAGESCELCALIKNLEIFPEPKCKSECEPEEVPDLEMHGMVLRGVTVLTIFLLGCACGQLFVSDCASTWNPISYYINLSAVMHSLTMDFGRSVDSGEGAEELACVECPGSVSRFSHILYRRCRICFHCGSENGGYASCPCGCSLASHPPGFAGPTS